MGNFVSLLPSILRVLEEQGQNGGWVDLAKLGGYLKNAGVDYQKLGYMGGPNNPGLREFLEKFPDQVELGIDSTSHATPVRYARKKVSDGPETTAKDSASPIVPQVSRPLPVSTSLPPVSGPQSASRSAPAFSRPHTAPTTPFQRPTSTFRQAGGTPVPPRYFLSRWAYFHVQQIVDFRESFRIIIKQLADMALDEQWYYGKDQDPAQPYPLLEQYLRYTFFRLWKEKEEGRSNKIFTGDKYAAFNTGLVNRFYDPIYALFEKNKIKDQQEWYFIDFCASGVDRAGKIFAANVSPKPERAQYFNDSAALIYDTTAGAPEADWDHIILDNVSRLPLAFLKETGPSGFLYQDTSAMDFTAHEQYSAALRSALEQDERKLRLIKSRLSESLETALKRVEWNFKTAIPQYFPTFNSMSLLLPLSLIDETTIDLALVAEKTRSGAYLGHTILPLAWAYNNARLIVRPDSDWLAPEHIKSGAPGGEEQA
jgi:hypothetical protein